MKRLFAGIGLMVWCCVLGCGGGSEPGPEVAGLNPGLYAEITTPKGKILLVLEHEKCPMTVANFVGLAEGTKDSNRKGKPFYNGLTFHRVERNFMIQGGCPDGNGRGGPGYRFPDEFDLSLLHTGPGILSMANAGPGTNGSQFFITHTATPWLDLRHTVFGHVVKGQEVVNAIARGDAIEAIKILRVGEAAQAFKADQAAFDALVASADARWQAKLDAFVNSKWSGVKTTASGLRYVVHKEGTGERPKKGTEIKAHYTGTLLTGTKFDSSRDKGRPFSFQVGVGRVVRGWDEAFLDMRKGEQRTLIIPPELGYGRRGAGPRIPPNATLVFDVELVDFQAGE